MKKTTFECYSYTLFLFHTLFLSLSLSLSLSGVRLFRVCRPHHIVRHYGVELCLTLSFSDSRSSLTHTCSHVHTHVLSLAHFRNLSKSSQFTLGLCFCLVGFLLFTALRNNISSQSPNVNERAKYVCGERRREREGERERKRERRSERMRLSWIHI